MRFALIGCDDTTLQIAEWIAGHERHFIKTVCQSGEYAEAIAKLHPNSTDDDEWEALLLNKEIDAVMVGATPRGTVAIEERADQLRKLIQESVPALLVHPACESIVAFELEMIRTDTDCPLVSYVPNKYHSAFGAFCDAVRDSDNSIGTVEQIVATRKSTRRDRDSVLRFLAQDALLITELIGNVKSVSASGATGEGGSELSNLSVSFAGESAAGARWCVEPSAEFVGIEISAIADRGKTTLTLADGEEDATLRVDGTPRSLPNWNRETAIEDAVSRLQSQIRGDEVETDLSRSFHALEIVDAVTQSCRRRRTIELLAEQPTEEDTFKAMMAAGGCGMLIWTLVLVILGPLLFLTGSTVLRIVWYVLLIGPICVFLALQLLRFVFDDKRGDLDD